MMTERNKQISTKPNTNISCSYPRAVSQKTCHPTFVHNIGKCWAIVKILSLLTSARNLQHCWYHISHRTLNMSLCYLEKY